MYLFNSLYFCHVFDTMCCPGTEKARGLAQTLLSVPYGQGDGEKLDVYIPSTNSLGMDANCTLISCPTGKQMVQL